MKKTWLLFLNSLQRMRGLITASAAVGILLCVLLTLIVNLAPRFSSPVSVGFLDENNSALSADLENYLSERLNFTIVEGDKAQLQSILVDKKISAIIVVPSGFQEALLDGSDGALQVTYMDDYTNRVFLESYLTSYMSSVQMLASVAQGDADELQRLLAETKSQVAPVEQRGLDAETARWYNDWQTFNTSFGFFVMIAALITIGMANIIFTDRQNNTFQRVQSTGVSAFSYVAAVCGAGFIAAVVMILIFLGYCAWQGFGMSLPLPVALILSLLYGLFCVGFALVIGLLSKSRSIGPWVILATTTIASMLGGAWFPISYAPKILQQIAHITPHFWIIDGLTQYYDGNTGAWVLSAIILALFSLLCFLVAGIRFASRSSTAH